jgi:hypothetical protein
MASCTILFSLRGLLIVEIRDMHNKAAIPRKIFAIVSHPFSVIGLIERRQRKESGPTCIFWQKRMWFRRFLSVALERAPKLTQEDRLFDP